VSLQLPLLKVDVPNVDTPDPAVPLRRSCCCIVRGRMRCIYSFVSTFAYLYCTISFNSSRGTGTAVRPEASPIDIHTLTARNSVCPSDSKTSTLTACFAPAANAAYSVCPTRQARSLDGHVSPNPGISYLSCRLSNALTKHHRQRTRYDLSLLPVRIVF
jgi:hypothetical protein